LLQALVSVALVVAIAMALLQSALANAKIESQHVAARIVASGLERGTGDFVRWAARSVAARGASTTWSTTTVSDGKQSACASNDPSCGASLAISFTVVGSTANATSGASLAENLQEALHENRISATISATLTDRDGTIVASAARLATIRAFDAPPYAILSGVRDATTIASSVGAAQGDTAGAPADTSGAAGSTAPPTPDPARPAADTDTTISVTMTCSNSDANDNPSRPFADDNAPGNDDKPWGVSGGSGFEAPCEPAYAFSATPRIPTDARPPVGDVYDVGTFSTTYWASRATTPTSWAP
jgi:hypothetical protein